MVTRVAEMLGISKKILYYWHSKHHDTIEQIILSSDQAEISTFKAELRRITEERDIPKKAAKYFANNPG